MISGLQYIFNVAMRDSNNISTAYQASNISFSLTTYQDCVADDECESQVSCSLYLSVVDITEHVKRKFVPVSPAVSHSVPSNPHFHVDAP